MSDPAPYFVDWTDLAFGSKRSLRELQAVFLAAPRELSTKRFTQIVKEYLPKSNLVVGLAKENFVLGFEDQPQFRTLRYETIKSVINKVNASSGMYKIYALSYFQREFKYIVDKIPFKKVLLVNGSWKYAFHTRESFYILAGQDIPIEYISPFTGEDEARSYEASRALEILPKLAGRLNASKGPFTAAQMVALAATAAEFSYDYTFQTGVTLGLPTGKARFSLLTHSFNRVVPYQTYAMHYGATRERHYSPPHDLNHYDTNHAEVELIIKAQKQGMSLAGTTLFINLLPCPACARMFTATDIAEFVYTEDHSEGYAIKMLEAAGKTVRRMIP